MHAESGEGPNMLSKAINIWLLAEPGIIESGDKLPLTKALISQRTPKLLDLPRKIFTPAPIHQRRDVIAHY